MRFRGLRLRLNKGVQTNKNDIYLCIYLHIRAVYSWYITTIFKYTHIFSFFFFENWRYRQKYSIPLTFAVLITTTSFQYVMFKGYLALSSNKRQVYRNFPLNFCSKASLGPQALTVTWGPQPVDWPVRESNVCILALILES